MIEIYADDDKLDLYEDEVIALTKQVNDIANLQNNQSDYTNTLRAPLTANNKRIYELANIISSNTDIPNRKISTKVIQNGIEIVSKGTMLLKETDTSFVFNIYGGNTDFFDAIDGKKITDLDLSTHDHHWTKTVIIASVGNTSGYTYSLIEFSDGDMLPSYVREVNCRFLHPCIFMKTIMDKIFSEAGYTKSGDVITDDSYDDMIVPVLNQKADATVRTNVKAEVRRVDTQNIADAHDIVEFPDVVNDTYSIFGIHTVSGKDGTCYDVRTDKICSFEIKIYYTIVGAGTVNIYLKHENKNTDSTSKTSGSGSFILTLTDVNCKLGDKIYVLADMPPGTNIDIESSSYFKCTDVNDFEFTDYGLGFPIAINLPDMLQKDFVKGIFERLGIVPTTNPITKNMVFNTFDDLYNNKKYALNWDDKVSDEKPSLIYSVGNYAQENEFKNQKDTLVLEEYGDGILYITNEQLEKRKTVLTNIFAATEMTTRLLWQDIPIIKLMTIEGDYPPFNESNTYYKGERAMHKSEEKLICNMEGATGAFVRSEWDMAYPKREYDPKPRILLKETKAVSVKYHKGDPADYTSVANPAFAWFILSGKSNNLGYNDSLLDDFYDGLKTILEVSRKLTVLAKLSAVDIYELDHFIPIYLTKYSAYFYVNRVSDWIEGQLAKVELIKL